MENKYCVYRHRRLDTNEIFYVGIGNIKRPYCKRRNTRGKFWYHITDKTEYIPEILFKNLTWEDAKDLEIFLISIYGRRDNKTGILCNMTDGGDGGTGCIPSLETRKKMSYARIGKPTTNKKVIDIVKGVIYESITEASIILNIKRTTLNAKLNGQNKNNTNLKYYNE